MSFLGEDFGRSGDLTVIWPLQLKGNTLRRTPFVIELRNIPFRQQEQVLFYVADRLPRFRRGRDGRARQRAVPGRDGDATIRRAHSAGDAIERVVSREYAAVQGGVRGRHDRTAARRGNSRGPSRAGDGTWRGAHAGAAQQRRRTASGGMATRRSRARSHTSRVRRRSPKSATSRRRAQRHFETVSRDGMRKRA